ncbi:MAG TPA: hypothetical protein VKP69_12305 [Isosphaeraceae bacterium]|nr:hypothetical protein [Isosphaeraceae bacterium]
MNATLRNDQSRNVLGPGGPTNRAVRGVWSRHQTASRSTSSVGTAANRQRSSQGRAQARGCPAALAGSSDAARATSGTAQQARTVNVNRRGVQQSSRPRPRPSHGAINDAPSAPRSGH